MLNLLLVSGTVTASEVVYYVLAIIGVILVSAFVVIFLGDLLMLLIAPKRNGLIFNRAHKKEKQLNKIQKKMSKLAKTVEPVNTADRHSEPVATPYNATVTPFKQAGLTDVKGMNEFNNFENDISLSHIDFNKANEEQKELESKFSNTSKKSDKFSDVSFSTEQLSKPVVVPVFEEEDDEVMEEDDEKEVLNLIDDIKNQALKELKKPDNDDEDIVLEKEDEPQTETIEFEEEEIAEQPDVVEVNLPKVKMKSPKLILKVADKKKTGELDLETRLYNPEEIERVVERVVERMLDEKKEVNNLRKIREDLLNLRINTFRDKKISEGAVSETRQQEIIHFEESVKEKLHELDSLKSNKLILETEKADLIKDNEKAEQEKILLETEIDNLKNELQLLKVSAGLTDKPYYSKEYYENRLQELEDDLKDVKKELRLVNREFNPLKKIKKTLERDSIKLRRKEAAVAKEKLKIYGINNVKNIDPEKVAKLETEVEVLNNLKDSVYHCETVMKQNKDRYPVLERSNKQLTKHINTLTKDIESVLRAIEWYSNH